ncbi:MAG: cyclic-di-AMP receptor [Firmicutes bacterium]|nr:cyclic-di-AMP receptor [Bacillota bacterium]
MKLMIAIINKTDAGKCADVLREQGYRFTKVATSGGFLSTGNSTLFLGLEDEQVDDVINIIRENSKKRTEMVTSPLFIEAGNMAMTSPIPVEVGGATIFITDVVRFEKV